MKKTVLGITGNMGVGKSTAVKMLKKLVLPVFESDLVVHRLMRDNSDMKALFQRKIPNSIIDNEINRSYLSELVQSKQLDVRQLEQMIYPYLEQELKAFFRRHRMESVVVLDVPLLFEAKWDRFCDKIIVLSAPDDVLKQRVFERFRMTEEKYEQLTQRQISDIEKRSKADYIIETNYGLEPVQQQLYKIIEDLK